jgi:asparagine synthase (glutamine-hydrolysing)
MCGIAGVLRTDGATREIERGAQAMGDSLAHRGPDDHGVWSDAEAGVALAHRRLAILDLSPTGHQPMLSADGRLVVTFNGEIFNFQELRADEAELSDRIRDNQRDEVMRLSFAI